MKNPLEYEICGQVTCESSKVERKIEKAGAEQGIKIRRKEQKDEKKGFKSKR